MKLKLTILAMLFFLTYGQLAYGQFFRARTYTTHDGLASNIVSDITQNRDNRLLFLTGRGINIYDGSSWIVMDDSVGLPKTWLSQFQRFEDGSIVCAGYDYDNFRVLIYEEGNWTAIPIDLALDFDNNFSITIKDSPKKIALKIFNTVYEYSLEDRDWKVFSNTLDGKSVTNLKYLGDSLYILSSEGFHYLTSGSGPQPIAINTPEKALINLIRLPNQETYLLGNGWIGYLRNNQFELINSQLDKTFGANSDIIYDGFANIYFNSGTVFYRLNVETNRIDPFHVDHEDGEPSHARLYIDHEKNLWISTFRGAFKINNGHFLNFNRDYGLFEDEGTAIAEIKPNHFFIGGVNSYNILHLSGRSSNFKISKTSNSDLARIMDYAKDYKSGQIYIAGGDKGFGILRENYNIEWVKSKQINHVTTVNIIDDTVYVATPEWVYQVKNQRVLPYVNSSAYIRQIEQLPDGRIILLTNKGISICNGNGTFKKTVYKNEQSSSFYSYAILHDRVIITSHLGLMELSNDSTIIPFTLYNHELRQPIYDILEDSYGDVWLGTDNGIYVANSKEIRHFTINNGLVGDEINRNSLLEDSNGYIWIGTNSGISAYNRQFDYHLEYQAIPSVLSVVDKHGVIQKDESPIKLRYNNNDLEFRFRAVSFYIEDAINYRIKLNGYEDNWRLIDNVSQNSVRYTNLPHGDTYRLQLQARVGSGKWSESAYSTLITIKNPFYSSWWFIVIWLGLIVLITYLTINYINQTRYNELLKKTVTNKTHEIHQSNLKLEKQNDLLQEEVVERKQAVDEKLKVINELVKTNKELDRFIYSASHDLSAPLKSLEALLHVAQIEKDHTQYVEYFKMMQASINQLERFIKELTDFSRNSKIGIKPKPIELKMVIGQILDNYRFLENFDRISWKYDISEDTKIIVVDEFRFRVILNNLISNAISFHQYEDNTPYVLIRSWQEDDKVKLQVEDNGQGVIDEDKDKIFQMFYRANIKSKGSGLGLYIVKEALDRINGTIDMESTLNEGTTFTLTFDPNIKASEPDSD